MLFLYEHVIFPFRWIVPYLDAFLRLPLRALNEQRVKLLFFFFVEFYCLIVYTYGALAVCVCEFGSRFHVPVACTAVIYGVGI